MIRHRFYGGSNVYSDEQFLSVKSAASLYGKGIFTTIAIRDGRPFLWDKHWRRLVESGRKLGIDLSEHNEDSTKAALTSLIADDRIETGRARVTFFDESADPMWYSETKASTGLLIMIADLRPQPSDFKLTASPYRINTTSPLAGMKTCNYLEPLLSLQDARSRGFEEAIRINESGEVASACVANIFWEKDGKLYTPSLDTGCLAGTTRELVLENLECEEVMSGIEELGSADRVFLTSAGVGVIQAASFDGRSFSLDPHAISRVTSY